MHADTVFTFYEAPRLPFIPLLGGGAEQYVRRGRRRIERDDARLRKRGLLFVAGEVRRDVVPVTLRRGAVEGEEPDEARSIEVDELEVYSTQVKDTFAADFGAKIAECKAAALAPTNDSPRAIVVVIFSPSGCDAMLRCLGYIDEKGEVTVSGKERGDSPLDSSQAGSEAGNPKYVIATIGPTTRDHLRQKYNFEPDICANKPSPGGVGEGITTFLKEKGLI